MFSDTRLGVWVSLGMDIAGGPIWRLGSSDWTSNASSTSQPPKRHAGSSVCEVEVDGGVNTGKISETPWISRRLTSILVAPRNRNFI